MKSVQFIAYRYLTSNDYFILYKPRRTEVGGGGQLYIDFPTSRITVDRWGDFFRDAQGVIVASVQHGQRWRVPVKSVGLSSQPKSALEVHQRRRQFDRDTHAEHVRENRLYWGKDGKAKFPRLKVFPKTENDGLVPLDIWKHEDTGTTDEGGQEVKAIFGHAAFTNPKPTRLIERALRLSTRAGSGDLVLDFFAGSGTTAHAVQKLNKEDGGNRRVILVSSTEATVDEPGKNLCRDVCATRVRRVIEGYNDTPGLGGDFAYLRCRRIAPGKLTEIDHAQVWTALQLTHMPTLSPLEEGKAFAVADAEDQRLIYVPHYRGKDGRALLKAVGGSPATIVYTWQPDLVRGRLRNARNVQVEAVPESLARRFGMRF